MSLTSIIRPLFLRRMKELNRYAEHAGSIQMTQLRWLLKEASQTEYGKKYGFSGISDYEEYCKRVPLVKYEDIRQYVMRMVEGESDILWKGKVRNFAQSSGTSDGKSK